VKRKHRPKTSEADYLAHRAFVEAARRQRCCAMCGKAGSDWHPHHVVYEQHLVAAGQPRWDPRNAMRVCVECHASHHNRSRVIPLSKLTDTHIEYAFEALGASAAYYLSKRYDGEDPRLDVWLERTEEVQDARSGSASGALAGTV
jgi:cytochrome c553